MRYVFTFPDIGEGIHEGTVLEWYVDKGQKVASGDNLVQVETDKVTADIPSPKDGVIVATFGKPGEVIKVGDALAEIEIEGVTGEEARAMAKEEPKRKTVEPVHEESFGVVGKLEVAGDGAFLAASREGVGTAVLTEKPPRTKALATPVARALAKDLAVDINQVRGTGPRGRVTREDIETYYRSHQKQPEKLAGPEIPTGPAFEYVNLSQVRKTIANRMTASKQTIPHFTAFEEIDVTELVKLRSLQRERFEKQGLKLTYMPFIIKAVVEGLKQHKVLNSSLDMENNRVIYKYEYNIGIAVDTSEGLIVPVIRNADRLSITELVKVLTETSQRARDRKLSLDEIKGGTFTITNYGSIAGIFGTPIINYPEVAILGAGRIREIPVVRNGVVEPAPILPLSLSADHRIVDGADAARFLNTVIELLRDPVTMLMGT